MEEMEYLKKFNKKNYLIVILTNESKKWKKNDGGLWIKIKDLIRLISKNLDDYNEKYTKFEFHWDDE